MPTSSWSTSRLARRLRPASPRSKSDTTACTATTSKSARGSPSAAPTHYTRRQTLTGAERYITEELKDFEDKVLSARERSLARETLLYETLLDTLNERLEPLKRCALALSELDVLACFSERAQALDWSRPQLSDTPGIRIERGRHPVVEAVRDEPFEPNDLVLRRRRAACW